MNADARPEQMEAIRQIGQRIREQVRQADLETAGDLAVERHQQVVALFSDLDGDGDMLAAGIRELLDEDRELIGLLTELRSRLEQELGSARRGARSARAYMEVADRR
ncbi:flagellar protein FliT [Wenzhouxiangella sp. AB-CW3]|uniref:flagellar protein FliT n=1 Tax=Wenzhouxiangella sp. AB-CW3 TaxID=2771012 RepID=UPI00168A7924|nr:flagellar protein FliT [Wenzhouxiangella sp. AB-CW3]QOC21212.1 flagellar protein FliT [Wenzhouxiangella sp. AB-CW3]